MLKKIKIAINRWKSSYTVAVMFLAYIFFVASAAIPHLLINIGNTVLQQENIIRNINSQYEGMLSEAADAPALHDKATYINLNGFMANVLDQPMLNERVKLKNGHLTSVSTDRCDDDRLQNAADNIFSFYEQQRKRGSHFLFVLSPVQISKYEDTLPIGYTDTSNETADAFLEFLEQRGVPYLDLREAMHEAGISSSDAFFVTDHHWTPQTGFWAYTEIVETLKKMSAISNLNSAYTDSSQYEFRIYEDFFLGSSGKRTGKYYAGMDDFCQIIPCYDTDIHVSIPEKNVDIRGRFEDVAYKSNTRRYLEEPDVFADNLYSIYGWGDPPVTYWRNSTAPISAKCMLIGDSFSNIPFSLLSTCFSSCDELDMRYFDGDFSSHYAALEPDIVIVLVNAEIVIAAQTEYEYFGK